MRFVGVLYRVGHAFFIDLLCTQVPYTLNVAISFFILIIDTHGVFLLGRRYFGWFVCVKSVGSRGFHRRSFYGALSDISSESVP